MGIKIKNLLSNHWVKWEDLNEQQRKATELEVAGIEILW